MNWRSIGGSQVAFALAFGLLAAPLGAAELTGWVDLHAHPMSNLAFGGKLVHGGPDVGSLLPADASCNKNVVAQSMDHALGDDKSTHGGFGFFDNQCGDDLRKAVIDGIQVANDALVTPDHALGSPNFVDWPRHNDITHQKMWVDWIKRANAGGLRVMVALATNNKTLADSVSGPGDGPSDDKASADKQIDAIKAFVARHGDFLAIAKTPAELRTIAGAGKTAIVLGVELDALGNFYRNKSAPSQASVAAELERLRGKGVRYVLPIHMVDNHFGGTAVYNDIFNFSNYREAGSFWTLECAAASKKVTFRSQPGAFDAALGVVKVAKLGMDPFLQPPDPPSCASGRGHANSRGLTSLGKFALTELMRLGMLIDIDHMSQRSADAALSLAAAVPSGGYPLNSGHNEFRGDGGSENSRTPEQLQQIAQLKGVFGLGLDSTSPQEFIAQYLAIQDEMGNRGIGFGTDMNGLVKGGRPIKNSVSYTASFPKSKTGNRTWDYNVDGMAHYGMLTDFIRALEERSADGKSVVTSLNKSAEF